MNGWRVTYSRNGGKIQYDDITNLNAVIGFRKNPKINLKSVVEISVEFGKEISESEINMVIHKAKLKSDIQRDKQRIEKKYLDKIKAELKLLF